MVDWPAHWCTFVTFCSQTHMFRLFDSPWRVSQEKTCMRPTPGVPS